MKFGSRVVEFWVIVWRWLEVEPGNVLLNLGYMF